MKYESRIAMRCKRERGFWPNGHVDAMRYRNSTRTVHVNDGSFDKISVVPKLDIARL